MSEAETNPSHDCKNDIFSGTGEKILKPREKKRERDRDENNMQSKDYKENPRLLGVKPEDGQRKEQETLT